MIDPTITTSVASAGKTSAAAVSATDLDENYTNFLTLLTAQISNQDPLKPVDSTQFVSQLAQLSQVEQSIATNANLESIGDMLASVGAMSDLQLIGRDVLVPSNHIQLTEEAFPLSYQVEAGAENVNIRIMTEDGNLVRELPGSSTRSGELIDVVWDRRDMAGLPVMPPDTFKVEITATDAQGEAVGVTSLTSASVERVNFTAAGAELQLSNGETVLSQIIRSVL